VNESLKSLGFSLVTLLVALGCSSAPHGGAEGGDDGGAASSSGGTASSGGGASSSGGASSGAASSSSGSSSSGGTSTGGVSTDDGGSVTSGADGGGIVSIPSSTSCASGVPTAGQPADVSNPTTVVGTGTPASCTFAALNTAVTAGGVITFNCGSAPVTIAVTATMNLPTGKDTVIDGGNLITLDGGHAVQILNFNHDNYRVNTTLVTVQHIAFVNAKTNPTDLIPTRPAPCSQGYDDGQGGAIYMLDGNLTVIDSTFMNDEAAQLGPDTGGGAIYINGSLNGVLVVGSTFTGNTASNGAAIGCLNSPLSVYNSYFAHNTATGNGANNNSPSTCSYMNNGQNEVGSGGNGGSLYSDGASVSVLVCGVEDIDNAAGTNAFGGGLFFTSDDMKGTLTIENSTLTGNTGGSWTSVASGSVTNVGTAVGTDAESITLVDSTLQGVN
jgi:hypothetical protein